MMSFYYVNIFTKTFTTQANIERSQDYVHGTGGS